MDNENSSLANNIQQLIDKSIEVNKVFLSTTSKLLRNITAPGEKKTTAVLNPNLLSEAFNAYATMNIQHMKNMLDLSISLMQKTNVQTTEEDDDPISTDRGSDVEPVFVLKGEAEAGGKVLLNFLLDNIKQEAVLCTLVHSPYVLSFDNAAAAEFPTTFNPQSFTLDVNAQQRINIEISIPATTLPGVYLSNVQVEGFAPVYFSIQIIVKESQKQTTRNGIKTKAKARK